MAINSHEWWVIKDLEKLVDQLGFRIGPDKYDGSRLALFPKGAKTDLDYSLPVYNRDTAFFAGSAEELRIFLSGWSHARRYLVDELRVSSWEKIEKKEAKVRHDALLDTLKNEKVDIEAK